MQRLRLRAWRKLGLSATVSLRALLSLAPIWVSLAQCGTKPQRISSQTRSTAPSSGRVSNTTGTADCGVMFQRCAKGWMRVRLKAETSVCGS